MSKKAFNDENDVQRIQQLVNQAHAAGLDAMRARIPNPMVVKDMQSNQSWFVPGGVCGFAWINLYGIRKNSKLGKAFIGTGFKKNDYEKCLQFWVHDGGQSMELKESYAYAFTKVIREQGGFDAMHGSRMD